MWCGSDLKVLKESVESLEQETETRNKEPYIVFSESSSEVGAKEAKKISARCRDPHQGSGKIWRQLHVIHLKISQELCFR